MDRPLADSLLAHQWQCDTTTRVSTQLESRAGLPAGCARSLDRLLRQRRDTAREGASRTLPSHGVSNPSLRGATRRSYLMIPWPGRIHPIPPRHPEGSSRGFSTRKHIKHKEEELVRRISVLFIQHLGEAGCSSGKHNPSPTRSHPALNPWPEYK